MMRAIGQPLNFSKAASEIEQICHSGKKVFEFCLRPPDWVVDCPPFGQLGGRDLVYQVAKCHGGEDGNHRDGAPTKDNIVMRLRQDCDKIMI